MIEKPTHVELSRPVADEKPSANGSHHPIRRRASAAIPYIKALAAPDTINTIPEKTLLAFGDHGALGAVLPEDGGDAESVIAAYAKAGIDDEQLPADLQRERAESFVESWKDLLNRIGSKSATLKAAG